MSTIMNFGPFDSISLDRADEMSRKMKLPFKTKLEDLLKQHPDLEINIEKPINNINSVKIFEKTDALSSFTTSSKNDELTENYHPVIVDNEEGNRKAISGRSNRNRYKTTNDQDKNDKQIIEQLEKVNRTNYKRATSKSLGGLDFDIDDTYTKEARSRYNTTTDNTPKEALKESPIRKPGTLGSKQALIPPRGASRSSVKRQEYQAPFRRRHANDHIDTKNLVDHSIVMSLIEFGQRAGIAEIPKESMDLCKKFTITIPDLDLR